jgi:hypothetical protein
VCVWRETRFLKMARIRWRPRRSRKMREEEEEEEEEEGVVGGCLPPGARCCSLVVVLLLAAEVEVEAEVLVRVVSLVWAQRLVLVLQLLRWAAQMSDPGGCCGCCGCCLAACGVGGVGGGMAVLVGGRGSC